MGLLRTADRDPRGHHMRKQHREQPGQQHQQKRWPMTSTSTSCPLCSGPTVNDIDHHVCVDCGSRCKPNPARSVCTPSGPRDAQ